MNNSDSDTNNKSSTTSKSLKSEVTLEWLQGGRRMRSKKRSDNGMSTDEDFPVTIDPSLLVVSDKPPVSAVSFSSSSSEDEESFDEDEERKCDCICGKPAGSKFLIECTKCQRFWHGMCVRLPPRKVTDDIKANWVCPICDPPSRIDHEKMSKRREQTAEKRPSKPKNQPKRKQIVMLSSSGARKPSATDVQIRAKAKEMMLRALNDGLKALTSNKDLPDVDEDVNVEQIAEDIEAALFEVVGEGYVTNAYRAKMTLLFTNLKRDFNTRKVLSGEIKPEQLVKMNAEDLASDDMKNYAEQIKQEKMHQTILTETQATAILKKTKKGEEMVQADEKIAPVAFEPTTGPSSILVAEGSSLAPSPIDDQRAFSEDELSTTLQSPVEKDAETAEAQKPEPKGDGSSMSSKSITPDVSRRASAVSSSIDQLLQKVKNESRVKVTGSKRKLEQLISPIEQTSPREERESLSPPVVPVVEMVESKSSFQPHHHANGQYCWKGRIVLHDVGSFSAEAFRLCGADVKKKSDWGQLMPNTWPIDGRARPNEIQHYLEETSGTRDLFYLLVYPDPTDSDREGFDKVFHYFYTRERYGVIGNRFTHVKDFYLVPLEKSQTLPDFLVPLDHGLQMRNRPTHLMLAILVVERPGQAMPMQLSSAPPDQVSRLFESALGSPPTTAPVTTFDPRLAPDRAPDYTPGQFSPRFDPRPIYQKPPQQSYVYRPPPPQSTEPAPYNPGMQFQQRPMFMPQRPIYRPMGQFQQPVYQQGPVRPVYNPLLPQYPPRQESHMTLPFNSRDQPQPPFQQKQDFEPPVHPQRMARMEQQEKSRFIQQPKFPRQDKPQPPRSSWGGRRH